MNSPYESMSWNNSPSAPSNCWNAMLLPVMDYGFWGILWFQGESNCNYYWSYSHLLEVMVSDWRARKGDSSARLPFYFAQLAPGRAAGCS